MKTRLLHNAVQVLAKPAVRFLLVLLVLFPGAQAHSTPPEITVHARVSTSAVPGDADDPAIWIHPTNPADSLVIGTDKAGNAIFVWDMNGVQRQRLPVLYNPNNGDVRYGMQVGGVPVDIYVVGAAAPSRLVVFKINPATRLLTDITTAGGVLTPQVKKPYGTALYRRPTDGALFAFVNSNGGTIGVLNQYRLMDDGTGKVKGAFVRSFGGAVNGKHSEGIVVDDQLGYVYIAEEDCCVHKFYADPDMGDSQLATFAHADGIDPDREGLGIYACPDDTGYILLSSQGNKRMMLYRREGDPGHPHRHTLVKTIYTPFIDVTDGLDVTRSPAGPNFPYGFVAKHDAPGRRFGLIGWEDIAGSDLTMCPTGRDLCEVTADFSMRVPSACAPSTVKFTDQSEGPVSFWEWDFGDGHTSIQRNPSHTYAVPGTYTVALKALSDTCSDTKTSSVTIAEAPVDSPASCDNLALNKPITASSVYAPLVASVGGGNPISLYTPERAVDGNAAVPSYWRSGDAGKSKPNSWLCVDLGEAYEVTRAVVRWKENYFAKRYRLQISNDSCSEDSDWTTVYTNNAGQEGTQSMSFEAPFAAQYFRIYIDQNKKPRNELFEFECYAETE